MSITPYNNYTVKTLNNIDKPYVNSTTEFGYFGNVANTSNKWYSMPTTLFTNNGVAIVGPNSGLQILQPGIYTLKLGMDFVSSGVNAADVSACFCFSNTYLSNSDDATGSFGSSENNKMFSFGDNATTYPGIMSWIINGMSVGETASFFSQFYINGGSRLAYMYSGTTNGSGFFNLGICTTEITFIINEKTTIYFNTYCFRSLTMGSSYFTLQLISNHKNWPFTNLIKWTWTQPTGLVNNSIKRWERIASSSDGVKLAAVVEGGQIWTSTNSGQTWGAYDSIRNWSSIASSHDGTKLVATLGTGQIYRSTNSGLNWSLIARPAPVNVNTTMTDIASSSDGTRLAAVVSGGQIYTSVNSGSNWAARATGQDWVSIASSSDGSKLAAVVSIGRIWTSTNFGETWTPRESPDNRGWQSIASSSDGTKLAAVVYGGQIYTSTNSGVSWTPRENDRRWSSIASSSDGTYLAAVVSSGFIYASTDSGVNWKQSDNNNREWLCISSSSDGTKLVAGVNGLSAGLIYTGVASY